MRNSLFRKVVYGTLSIFLAVYGFRITDSFLNSPSDQMMDAYRQFCREGIQTTARLDSQYFETTYKLLKRSSGAEKITLKYHYTVRGRQYSAQNIAARLPDHSDIEITYLAGNPGVSTLVRDPCRQYALEKERQKPFYDLILGGIMILAAMGVASSVLQRN